MINPFKFIKHIKIHLIELKQEADSTLKSNIEFLDSGKWCVNKTLTVFYKKQFKKESQKETSNVVGALTKTSCDDNSTKIARKIFVKTYKYRIENNIKTFCGQTLITSTRGLTYRFVNYKDKTLFTKYARLSLMKSHLDALKQWGEYFNVAKTLKVNNEKMYTIEEYISKIDCPFDVKFQLVLQDYIEFFKKIPSTENSVLTDQQKENIIKYCNKNNCSEEISHIINFLQNGGYIKCLSHGDLSYYNVLFDGEKTFYIDLECLNIRIFLHDIFQYMMWYKWYKNYALIDRYFEGKFDREFSLLFSVLGLRFNKEYRKAYFLIMKCAEQFQL